MIVVGLTGGMACGKSFVARVFAELGAHCIEADALGHLVLEPGGEAYAAVVSEFGQDLLDEGGRINRSLLAKKAFSDDASLARLNELVHPAVRTRAVNQIEEISLKDPAAVIIYAAAILIESGASEICQKVVVVSCTREQQVERALERSQLTKAEISARIGRQMPLEEKREYADFIIDASGTKEETMRQTKLVYEQLLASASQ